MFNSEATSEHKNIYSFQLVHGTCSKTRVAYILSLLREQPAHPNDTTLLDENEEESDEEGDITMFDPEVNPV